MLIFLFILEEKDCLEIESNETLLRKLTVVPVCSMQRWDRTMHLPNIVFPSSNQIFNRIRINILL